MAIGLLKLTKNQRKSLYGIFLVLNFVQTLLGLVIIVVSLYVCLAIAPMIVSEKAEINFVFGVYAIFGINIAIHWLIGWKICTKCYEQAQKKSTKSLLLLWCCAGTNTVIFLIIIAHMSKKANHHIVKSMKNSIQGGMKTYLIDLESKEAIDKIQYQLECCGFESYKDWYNIEWMDGSIVNSKASLVEEWQRGLKHSTPNPKHLLIRLRFESSKLALPVVPWSCCKVDFPMQCLHDPLQQTAFTNIWVDEPKTVAESLNAKGCVDKMKTPIGWVIEGLVLIICAITFFHIIIFVISRLLYTSCRNAILLCDPEGIAPGWLFGRGDCGYARGKTLTEIMGITNETLETRIIEQKKKEKMKPTEEADTKKSEGSERTISSKATTLFESIKQTAHKVKPKKKDKKNKDK